MDAEGKMDPVRSYNILLQRLVNEDRLSGQRASALVLSNSVLLAAFFMAERTLYFKWACAALPLLGIAISIAIGVALLMSAKATIASYKALCQIEQEPDFAYMKDKGIRPFTDLAGMQIESKKHLWKLGCYVTPGFSIPFIIIWSLCLASL